jgi:hypothetical protein
MKRFLSDPRPEAPGPKPARAFAQALALTLFTSAVGAEQMYVHDKLVLNVYAEPTQGSSRVATIETGDAVEVVERVDNFVRVQLDDGREGWVGANYLSAEPPAIVRLRELRMSADASTEPPKQLTDEIARLKKQNGALQSEVADLKKQLAAAPPVSEAAAPAVHEMPEPVAAPAPQPMVVVDRSHAWAWVLAVIAAGAGGFAAGYQTLGRRVRARFGGVKVY